MFDDSNIYVTYYTDGLWGENFEQFFSWVKGKAQAPRHWNSIVLPVQWDVDARLWKYWMYIV